MKAPGGAVAVTIGGLGEMGTGDPLNIGARRGVGESDGDGERESEGGEDMVLRSSSRSSTL